MTILCQQVLRNSFYGNQSDLASDFKASKVPQFTALHKSLIAMFEAIQYTTEELNYDTSINLHNMF